MSTVRKLRSFNAVNIIYIYIEKWVYSSPSTTTAFNTMIFRVGDAVLILTKSHSLSAVVCRSRIALHQTV